MVNGEQWTVVFLVHQKASTHSTHASGSKNRTANGDEQRITALTWDPVNTHAPHCLL